MMENEQLRIAMISVHSCPVGTLGTRDTGGMSVYIVELASALGKLGHLVDVYTRVHDPNDRQIYSLGRDVSLIHLKAGEDEQIHKLAIYPHLPDFASGMEEFRTQNNLQYDVLFSHYWLSAIAGETLRQWWKIPHLTMFHTLGAMKNAAALGEDEPELRTETEKALARRCTRIIAPTEREKDGILLHCGAPPENISIVPCGVNLDLFKPKGKEKAKRELGLGDGKIILSVGRLEPVKGIEQLLKAFAVTNSRNAARLVIIGGDGNNPLETVRLQMLSRELDIEERVSFFGVVRQEELPDYYSAADLTVISSYYESFGLVALESLACGTPVVTTDVGGARDIIHEGFNGFIAADNEPINLAEKIDLGLAVFGNGNHHASKMRGSISKYDWSKIATKIICEFKKTLATRETPVSSECY